jgi:hypothetical protein
MIEKWVDITGFDNYQLSDIGRVRNLVTGNMLKLCGKRGNDKYKMVVLRKKGSRKQYSFCLHRLMYELFIGPIPEGMLVDHKDRDSLNNTLTNLRLATYSQNNANRGPVKKGTKYKGVSRHSINPNKWVAQIKHNKKAINLGSYATEEEAAEAYNKAAKKLQGEFAYTNSEGVH